MPRQKKSMSAVAAAAERVRAATVRGDAEIAALNGVTAESVTRSKKYLGLPADASAAELRAAAEAYVEHGPDDPAKRPVWEDMVARTRAARESSAASTAATSTPPAISSKIKVEERRLGPLGVPERVQTYRGQPVANGSTGVPHVATVNGWVTVAEASGFSDADLKRPYLVARAAPGGPVAQMLSRGPG